MKSRLFPVMLVLACAGLFAQNVSLEEAVQSSAQTIDSRLPKGSKVAVLSFTASKQDLSSYVIDEIAAAISASNKIQVIERQYLDVIRKELNIQMSGDVSDDEVRRVGKQLGAQYVVTGSLVDVGNAYRFRVAAINVESAVREASPVSNIHINDPQVVFLLTGQRPTQTVTTNTYKIGDKGPGGGIIFFAEGGVYKECSGELGRYNWDDAMRVAQNHKGGGFSDWRLPDRGELGLMYRNLKKKGLGGFSDRYHWSSSESGSKARGLSFSNGGWNLSDKSDTEMVRAVRSF